MDDIASSLRQSTMEPYACGGCCDRERESAADEIDRLKNLLAEIRGELGACLVQRAPSDDAIIFEHIQSAYDLSKPVR